MSTHECAMVPLAGTPYSSSASVHAVPTHPPMYAARAPITAASFPCARLEPNSATARPSAARTILFALVAIRDWWLMVSSRRVSIICACAAGALTVTIGSPGKIGVPSGTAYTSPVNLKSLRYRRKPSPKTPFERKYSMSPSSKRMCSMFSIICSTPAMMANPPPSGTERKNMSKTASLPSMPLST